MLSKYVSKFNHRQQHMPASACPGTEHMPYQNKARAKALMIWMRLIDSKYSIQPHHLLNTHSVPEPGVKSQNIVWTRQEQWYSLLADTAFYKREENQVNMPITKTSYHRVKRCDWVDIGASKGLTWKSEYMNWVPKENSRCCRIDDKRWTGKVGS
jgi:hypothetical protein